MAVDGVSGHVLHGRIRVSSWQAVGHAFMSLCNPSPLAAYASTFNASTQRYVTSSAVFNSGIAPEHLDGVTYLPATASGNVISSVTYHAAQMEKGLAHRSGGAGLHTLPLSVGGSI